jgi:ubiquinone/menaquinone biosynthesis C-methylase UbiE
MKVRIAISVLVFSQAFLAAQNKKLTMEEMHQLHQDSKAYIAYLEDPERDIYQKPHEVIMALGLREGETVADIGAGSGYFTFRLASPVGEKGRIYAVDTSPDMILHMNRRIRDMKLRNIVTVLSAPDDPLLMDGSIDRFFICDTWHHIQNQAQYLALMKKMLKPGGQVIMIDFQKRELPVGAPLEMKITREDLVQQMESNGFKLVKEHTFLPYQYFLIFTSR